MSFKKGLVAAFKNANGSVSLTELGEAFIVTAEPKYGDKVVNSHADRKVAERDYAYFQHYFTS